MSVLAASMAFVAPLGAGGGGVSIEAVFAGPGAGKQAVTFDQRDVPAGARVGVVERTGPDGTTVELTVHGLQAHRTFGAHVHQKTCGTVPEASGPHYQDVKDPRQPSTDPAYANARNEVWLDFTTDGQGDGSSVAHVAWRFRAGQAMSVVVHAHGTADAPGQAGTAGPRLACVNVPFE
ncbi:superoxide dismutase family protein [Streptomyces sp. NPDC049555]|uniref:superoxide dismutase family protein n=1 Tax=unclassified Streptomyces TaxID=2593676 RepID=UPI00342E6C22